jgi:hypothetical protein
MILPPHDLAAGVSLSLADFKQNMQAGNPAFVPLVSEELVSDAS